MGSQRKKTRRNKIIRHPVLLLIIPFIIIAQILFFSPREIEAPSTLLAMEKIDPSFLPVLLGIEKAPLAPQIPENEIPSYTIQGFKYLYSVGGVKKWKIEAQKAHFYSSHEMIHSSHNIHAVLFSTHPDDPSAKNTEITGDEAIFYTTQEKDFLEIFGNAHTIFPDQFEITSEYTKYFPNKKIILIPPNFIVSGEGKEKNTGLQFKSYGLYFDFNQNEILLPKDVYFFIEGKTKKDNTHIYAAKSKIDRTQKIATFFVDESSKNSNDHWVRIEQTGLKIQSKKAQVRYEDGSQKIQSIQVEEKVTILEFNEKNQLHRKATCGEAEFNSQKNLIYLKKYPQVYQNNDTITGEQIIIHRDSDTVEVEYGNAYVSGEKEE